MKIRKINSTPTITLKRPNTKKTVVKILATLSACLMPSYLTVTGVRGVPATST
jgi:hypothetical protein